MVQSTSSRLVYLLLLLGLYVVGAGVVVAQFGAVVASVEATA